MKPTGITIQSLSTDQPGKCSQLSGGTGEDHVSHADSRESGIAINPRALARELAAFRTPRTSRSIWEVASTFVPFAVLIGVMLFALQAGYYSALALTPFAGMLLLRLFIIQHDCGHGSFFKSKKVNTWLGRSIGVLTLTPYDCWRRSHELHHASTGNLDARGYGDVDTLTVREYRSKGRWGRFSYRLYRHPIVLMGLGPAYLFLVRHRLPIGLMKAGWLYWISALGTNAVTAAVLIALGLIFGAFVTTMVFLPVLLTAASVGVWLFYVQHQFEDTHWDNREDWDYHASAIGSSSYLHLPAVMNWFTGNISIHHVHHLVSRIPFYRLPAALKAHPELMEVNRVSAREAVSTMWLTLWDEDRRKLISFREASRLPA
ncbi:fatty acid desaturase [Erythrobacter insulae]|uniref:Fatty acid desaturase n=1 Tax=Erythrobacter insulae TaxID=2584124 RepID=A0A547PC66_9SPHN|nr:fatty acid desaturase [Erythrobacter insulae]TRD11737.1 fatty acid desaturase [Erythrobacter insulae]